MLCEVEYRTILQSGECWEGRKDRRSLMWRSGWFLLWVHANAHCQHDVLFMLSVHRPVLALQKKATVWWNLCICKDPKAPEKNKEEKHFVQRTLSACVIDDDIIIRWHKCENSRKLYSKNNLQLFLNIIVEGCFCVCLLSCTVHSPHKVCTVEMLMLRFLIALPHTALSWKLIGFIG